MAQDNILKVHLSTVRPVLKLEYVVPVWKAIRTIYPMKSMGAKSALRRIYPEAESLHGGPEISKR